MKLIGITVILTGCLLLSLNLCSTKRQRIRMLFDIKEVFLVLQGEIRFGLSSLPEVFTRMSKDMKNDNLKNLLQNCADELDKNKFESIEPVWNKNVEKYMLMLEPEDISLVKNFSNIPVMLDTSMQEQFINEQIVRLDRIINDAQKKIESQCRVYRCVVFSVGLMISIVLI